MNQFRFRVYNFSQDPRVAGLHRAWASQPGWVWRIAIVAGLVFVVLPIVAIALVLGLTFALIFGLVFAVLAGANRLGALAGRASRGFRGGGDDGRRNVRVIRREDEPPFY